MTTPEVFDHKRFLAHTTRQPGIYQMYGEDGRLLYVGKAKNLKNRLASYFRSSGQSLKTRALVARIRGIDVTVTASETEALILEQNLIKSHRPPYNILLRDDKSYPYIFLSSNDTYPRVTFHRGAKRKSGDYYGPYPNSGAVRDSLNFLQKTFKVRQCEDSVFRNRSRPCLQYQIDRCTAPCVDFISPEEYAEDVRHTRLFLSGQSDTLLTELADRMEAASQALDFERAAALRDRITALRSIQSRNAIEEGQGNLDVVAAELQAGMLCVHLLYVREGRILGSRSYYPEASLAETESEVLAQFLPQFYLASEGREIPAEIITSHPVEDAGLLAGALEQSSGRRVTLTDRVRTHRARWLDMATTAARQNLASRLNSRKNSLQRFEALQEALSLDEMPQRLECFDISHSSGELAQASCVVFNTDGPLKSDYRRFNIEGITGGDDYAAMTQALQRRYTRLQKGEGKLPDILLIDGGKGQLTQARSVLAELGVNQVMLLGVAKGSSRKPGLEVLHWEGRELSLPSDSSALHLIQHIRDEAHRFAITGHRQRRDKKRRTSSLEGIPGVGAKRRRELLRHFGGLQEVRRASVDDLAKVPGLSRHLAEAVHGHFHQD